MKYQIADKLITVAKTLETRTYRDLASVWVMASSINDAEDVAWLPYSFVSRVTLETDKGARLAREDFPVSISWSHLMVLAFYVVVLVVPFLKLLRRVGFSGWWSILAVVPLVNLAALWVSAFMRWPIDHAPGRASPPG